MKGEDGEGGGMSALSPGLPCFRGMRWYWGRGEGGGRGVALEMVHEDVCVALFPRRPGDKAGRYVLYE